MHRVDPAPYNEYVYALEMALLGEDAEKRHDEGDVVVLAPHVLLLWCCRGEGRVDEEDIMYVYTHMYT